MQQPATSILAYSLGIDSDGSYMLGPETFRGPETTEFHDWRFGRDGVPHPAICRTCGRKTDPKFINPAFRANHRCLDTSATHDGYFVVSRRFREWCETHDWTGTEFVALSSDADFFVFRATQTVAFDAQRRRTRFEELCPTCGDYYSIVGAKPRYLKGVDNPLRGGFFRTDIEFGSGPEQHPVIIVGVDVAERLRDSGLTGFHLDPILA